MSKAKNHYTNAWIKFLLIACILLTQIFGPALSVSAADELGLTAAALSDSKVKLDWTSFPGAEYYEIYREPDGSLLKTIDIKTDLNFTSYTDSSGLEPEATYSYTVKALDPLKTTELASSMVSVTTLKISSPTILSAAYDINSGEVTLKWKHNSPKAAGSIIKRSDGSTVVSIDGSATTCTFSDENIVINLESMYVVQSVDSGGHASGNSAPLAVLPIAPPSVTSSIKNGVVTVSWDQNTGISNFNLERSRYEGSAWGSWSAVNTGIKAGSSSVTDTPNSGGTFRYRLNAKTSGSYSGCSNISDTVVRPVPPRTLNYSIISSTEIRLNWTNDLTNESALQVERKVDSGGYETIANLSKTENTYTDTGSFKLNSTYYYVVTAYDSDNNRLSSPVCSVVTGVPAAPSSLSLTVASATRIDLSWRDNSNNEQGFKVERRTDSGSYSTVGDVAANTTGFSDTGVTTGHTYTYRVRAYNAFGSSTQYSNEVYSTTSALAAPVSLTVTTVSSTQIDLTWTYPGSQKYSTVIERKKDGDSSWSTVTTVASGVFKYSNTGLTSNTRYFYRVKAVSGSNTYSQPYPNDSIGKGAYTKLNKPTNLTGKASTSTQIDLAWTDNSDETGFVIERKTGSGSYSVIATTGANARSFSDRGLVTNVYYTYRIKAVTSSNTSDYSNEITVVCSLFAFPTELSAVAVSDSDISLSWKDNSGNESGFEIWKKVGSAGTWKKIAVSGKNTASYTDDDLSRNTQYYYKVRAYISSGSVFTDFSNEATARTIELDSPDGLSYNIVSGSRITLTWSDNSQNEDGYKVERKVKSTGTWEVIADLDEDTDSLTVKDLTRGTQYFFRVKAYVSKYNRVACSAEIQVNTAVPEAPSDLTLEVVSPMEIELKWDDNSDDETGFIIERSEGDNKDFEEADRVDEDTESYTDKGLDPHTRYYYRVTAYNKYGKSPASDEEYAYTKAVVTFNDIGGSFIWAKDAIEDLASRGIIKGRSDTIFAPGATITRAEFTCLMLRTFELDTSITQVTPISDIKSDKWFYRELMVAKKLGIIKADGNNCFYPEKPITREEMCIIIVKTLNAADKTLPMYSTTVLNGFTDTKSISSDALYSVASLVGEGIMNGKPGNRIAPKETANRAEAAALIYRVLHR